MQEDILSDTVSLLEAAQFHFFGGGFNFFHHLPDLLNDGLEVARFTVRLQVLLELGSFLLQILRWVRVRVRVRV